LKLVAGERNRHKDFRLRASVIQKILITTIPREEDYASAEKFYCMTRLFYKDSKTRFDFAARIYSESGFSKRDNNRHVKIQSEIAYRREALKRAACFLILFGFFFSFFFPF